MIRNAFILLFSGRNRDRVLLLQQRNGEWMIPGGIRESAETPQQAAMREFLEEVGQPLPHDALWHGYFLYHKHSIIFVVSTNTHIHFKTNAEAIGMHWAKWQEVFNYNLRSVVRKSLCEITQSC